MLAAEKYIRYRLSPILGWTVLGPDYVSELYLTMDGGAWLPNESYMILPGTIREVALKPDEWTK